METQHAHVLVYCYTYKRLAKLICNPCVKRVHVLIQNWYTYPKKSPRYRVDLELREKNNLGNFIRPANLFELVWFSIRSYEKMSKYSSVEGFDSYLDELGKETGIPLTIPVISFSGGLLEVLVVRNDRASYCFYQLVVTSIRSMDS